MELCLLTGHRLSSPASKCSLAGFSLSKTPHSSPPPAHGGLGGSRSRSSSRRLLRRAPFPQKSLVPQKVRARSWSGYSGAVGMGAEEQISSVAAGVS